MTGSKLLVLQWFEKNKRCTREKLCKPRAVRCDSHCSCQRCRRHVSAEVSLPYSAAKQSSGLLRPPTRSAFWRPPVELPAGSRPSQCAPPTWRMCATAGKSPVPGRDTQRGRRSPPAQPCGGWRSTALSLPQWKSLCVPQTCSDTARGTAGTLTCKKRASGRGRLLPCVHNLHKLRCAVGHA